MQRPKGIMIPSGDRLLCEHYNEVGDCMECEEDYKDSMKQQPTLRDRFAMSVMSSIAAVGIERASCKEVANKCYQLADALMAAR